MNKVYLNTGNIISPLGFTLEENTVNISKGKSGISLHNTFATTTFHASIIEDIKLNSAFEEISDIKSYTKLERMMILSLKDTIKKAAFKVTNKTALIVSTTKGNIDVLDRKQNHFSPDRAYLSVLAQKIKVFFNFSNEPIVVSNACVSGIMAVSIAKRLIQNGSYDNAFIVSGDIVSEFIISGFNSFQAISKEPCKPYSKNRKGITLGEAAASASLSKNASIDAVQVIGDASCNDANHISGPSRTGEGLYKSICAAIKEANITSEDIDYISAHGTATIFNDEMEAIAFNRVQLTHVPLNSLKGYYGHTLGASGLLETLIGVESLKNNKLYSSLGFDELGVSMPINVIKETKGKQISTFLKTASGFGGCNTAVLFKKAYS